jgi:hypothetical protein
MLIIIIILYIIFLIYLISTFKHKTRPLKNKSTLFLYFEDPTIITQQMDFTKFPSADVVNSQFSNVAIVVPNRQTILESRNDLDIIKNILPSYSNVEYWINIYFGADGFFCSCRASSEGQPPCKSGGCRANNALNTTNCSEAIQNCFKNIYEKDGVLKINDIPITGILFDDEEGDSVPLEAEMNKLAATYNLKLAWTSSVSTKCSPGNNCNTPWDYNISQIYTMDVNGKDDTIYQSSCQLKSNFWNNVENLYNITEVKNNADIMVPMLCGTGNCILTKECMDERLSVNQLENLINSRPKDYIFKNLGIWYGVFPNSSTGSPPYTAFGCTTNNVNCKTGCCNTWT